ncbi:MAG: hypothetical protein MJ135_04040, partial [Oscillospiraceae bacterium]|nr:hypothetical protein [Oscillospiraceae bacterium]
AILGADYASVYQIGDSFQADYLFSSFNFEVTGFLERGSEIAYSHQYTPLDSYVVIPFFRFEDEPQSEKEWVTQKIHNANLTSGEVVVPVAEADKANELIQEILSESSVGEYSASWSSINAAYQAKEIHLNEILILLCAADMGIFALFCLTLSGCCKARLRLRAAIAVSAAAILCVFLAAQPLLGIIGMYYMVTIPFVTYIIILLTVVLIMFHSAARCRSKFE